MAAMWVLAMIACDRAGPPPRIEVAVDATISTAVVATWSGPVDRVRVTFRQPGHEPRTACAPGDAEDLRLPLLEIGVPVDWTAEIVSVDGAVHVRSGRIELPPPPPLLLDYRVTDVDPVRSEVAGGLIAFAHSDRPTETTWAVVVDGAGRVRFAWTQPPERRVQRVHLARDGGSLLIAHHPRDDVLADDAILTRVPLDGAPATDLPLPDLHHDFTELPDGQLAWLGFDGRRRPVEGREGELPVMTDRVLVGSGEAEPVVRFSFQDDYGVEPWWPCEHMRRGSYVDGYHEWTHSNSLVAADDGGMFVMMRNLDGIVRLGPDGRLRWQLGGRDGTLRLVGDEGFHHAHFSWAEGDRVLVFDNGVHTERPSRVVEYRVDEAAGTAERVWSFEEPFGRRLAILGDARRLPGGNTLVALGHESQLFEVTPEGEVVWWMDLVSANGELEHTVQRVTFAPDLDGPWLCP